MNSYPDVNAVALVTTTSPVGSPGPRVSHGFRFFAMRRNRIEQTQPCGVGALAAGADEGAADDAAFEAGTITRRVTGTCRATCRIWFVIVVTGTWTATQTGT